MIPERELNQCPVEMQKSRSLPGAICTMNPPAEIYAGDYTSAVARTRKIGRREPPPNTGGGAESKSFPHISINRPQKTHVGVRTSAIRPHKINTWSIRVADYQGTMDTNIAKLDILPYPPTLKGTRRAHNLCD